MNIKLHNLIERISVANAQLATKVAAHPTILAIDAIAKAAGIGQFSVSNQFLTDALAVNLSLTINRISPRISTILALIAERESGIVESMIFSSKDHMKFNLRILIPK